jgi:hypothetical protein
MRLRDFRVGWRLLLKEPVYSGAVVCGLAVGFAACFLLLALVRYAFSYNSAIANSDRIYVVKERRNALPRPEWTPDAPPPRRQVALDSGLAQDATAAKQYDVQARVEDRFVPLALQVARPNYLHFFGIKAIEGDAGAALARPGALVLSASTAARLFGHERALGKVVRIDGEAFQVAAVLADLPPNTSVAIDALVGEGAYRWAPPPKNEWFERWSIYLKAAPGAGPAAVSHVLQDAQSTKGDLWMTLRARQSIKGPLTSIEAVKLSDIYFDPGLLASRGGESYGSKAGVLGLAALAVLILVLAMANYVNLAAIRTVARQREIGVRKALGVTGARLAQQFMAESTLVAMAATVVGLAFAWLVLPLFSELVSRPLAPMLSWQGSLLMLLLGLVTGLLAGLYPALLALRLPASVTLQGRGNGETGSGLRVRRALSVLQFGAAIALVAATVAVGWQTRYASQADPGFDPARLLVVTAPDMRDKGAVHAFQEELARLPGVSGVAQVSEAIGRDGFKAVIMIERDGNLPVPIELKAVGSNFFDVYGVRPVAGRLFDKSLDRPGNSVVLNARGALALGYASPEAAVGQMLDEKTRIVGIAPDLRYQTLRQQPGPMLYRVEDDLNVLTVRTGADQAGVRAAIEALWARHFPNDPPEIDSAGSIFAHNYNEDRRLARILGLASLVATTLASFGIYVLAAYSVKRRAREIVLRKLHGARARDIARLVTREFGTLIGIGALAGLPLAWLAIERYLASFVERAPMGQWPLAGAVALVALVGIGATARQTFTAARMSPALALRD